MNHTFIAHVFEGAVLSAFAAYQGSRAYMAEISDKDWDRMTGPHALAFAAVTAVLVLWATLVGYIYRSAKEQKKQKILDDAATDKRHQDQLEQQREAFEALTDIHTKTVEGLIKSNHAIEKLAKNIEYLTVAVIDQKEKKEEE
jgi:hypothetical protein